MPSFSVQNIIDRAAAAADMHDSFVNDTTWLNWFNKERQALTILMARAGWVPSGIVSQAVPFTDSYTLAADMLAVLTVVEVDSSGRFRHLIVSNFVDQVMQAAGGPITGSATRVFLEQQDNTDGTIFHFYPRPTAGNYLIYYLKAPTRATAATDTFNMPMGFEEWLVLQLARRALVKEESDPKEIDKQIVDEERLIEEYCWNRALADSPKVRNTDNVNRGWDFQLAFPPPNAWVWL